MNDPAYSLMLLAGLLAGPSSSFLVGIEILPVYAIFPILGLLTNARRGMLRLLPLVSAPVLVLLWGVLSGNGTAAERSLRWVAAVVTGASMSGALGASRASKLLFSISGKVSLGGLTESLAMAVSMAGPFSRRIKDIFIRSRKKGMGLTDSFSEALSSVHGIGSPEMDEAQARSVISLASACLAWILLLAGIMGVI
jgi:hypothetical protein